jgi:phosphatidylserine decarboxylase
VFNVHVQNAPLAGRVTYLQHTEGQFLSALKLESAALNENVLIGIEAEDGRRVGVRLIAGVIARRIVPFVKTSDVVARGERISLIQFGSRVDLYLAPDAQVRVKLGDKVTGGETAIAQLG